MEGPALNAGRRRNEENSRLFVPWSLSSVTTCLMSVFTNTHTISEVSSPISRSFSATTSSSLAAVILCSDPLQHLSLLSFLC